MHFDQKNWQDCPWDLLLQATLRTSPHAHQDRVTKFFARGKEQVKLGNAQVIMDYDGPLAKPTPKHHVFIHPQTNGFLMIGLMGSHTVSFSHSLSSLAEFLNRIMEKDIDGIGYCGYIPPQDLEGYKPILEATHFSLDPAAAEDPQLFKERQGALVSNFLCYSRRINQ